MAAALARTASAAVFVTLASVYAWPQGAAVLRGKVLNDADDKPVPRAEISIPSLKLSTLADSTGTYLLSGIPGGPQIVWVRRLGFERLSAVVTFAGRDTAERDFSLTQAASATLPEIDISAAKPAVGKLAEFEERRKLGIGQFISEADLARQAGRSFTAIMATIAAPNLLRGRGTAAWVIASHGPTFYSRNMSQQLDAEDFDKGAKPGQCYTSVMVDGSLVYHGGIGGEHLFDLYTVDPTTVAGVEFYSSPATIPSKYNGTGSACGLLIIWTKT